MIAACANQKGAIKGAIWTGRAQPGNPPPSCLVSVKLGILPILAIAIAIGMIPPDDGIEGVSVIPSRPNAATAIADDDDLILHHSPTFVRRLNISGYSREWLPSLSGTYYCSITSS